ncbi:MAG: hypothetical protein LBC65_04525 [Oscillospiraceae bacterium]|jgi:uncharacterized protein YybS (DUF2232 family)|nr:hypothetical protein [Oscillospiraceae bacterium]
MDKKQTCGLVKLIGIITVIIGVFTVVAAVLTHWDELRAIFPWMPEWKRDDFDDDCDDYEDFADL